MMNEWIISSSLLIGAVLLGRFLLWGKVSLRLQYALWLVVLVRLLLPVQLFTSDFSAGSVAQSVDMAEPVRQVYASAREDTYEREYDAAYSQVVAEYQARLQTVDPVTVEREAQTRVEQKQALDLKQLLYGIWFAGMVVMTSVIVSCNVHLGLHLKRRRWEFPTTESLLPVYVTEAVPTPCIFGFFHPAVYLTPEAASDEQVRAHVLTHELTHYRHLDHIWSVLRSVCLILHWYNPLVWMAAKVSRADAELACDEGALAKLGEEHRADYGRTLIGLTCAAPIGDLFITATTMTGSAGSIRERIRLLMKQPRNTVLALTAVVLIGTIIVGCAFAGAPETTKPDLTQLVHDGVLVYPGTEWTMTPEAIKEALDISAEDIIDEREALYEEEFDGTYGYYDLSIRDTILGYPAEVTFQFQRYAPDAEPGLFQIYVKLGDTVEFEVLMQELTGQLGESTMDDPVSMYWYSGKTVHDCVGQQAYKAYIEQRGAQYATGPASSVTLASMAYDYDGVLMVFRSELARAIQAGEAAAAESTDSVPEFGTVAYFDDLLNPGLYRSEADWYPLALTSFYDSPAGIDLFQLFYNGIPGADNTITPEEQAFLENEGTYEPDFDLDRIPAAEMDRVLTEYFGVTLAETAQIGLANFIYNPDTDCYYHCHTDTNLDSREVTDCEELPTGAWRVRYTSYLGEADVTLRQRDGVWQIVSNLPVEPSSLLRSDGMIVFPGTEWNMSEAELLEALNIQEYGVFSGMRGIFLPETTFWGYPVSIAFYFDQYTTETEWGLFGVMMKFGNEADFDAVRDILLEQLGSPDFQTSGASFECWNSDVRTEELVSAAAYEQYLQERTVSVTENNIYADGAAVTVSCYGAGTSNENTICFDSWHTKALQIESSLVTDQAAEVRALFAEGGDPWYLAALAAPYADYHSFDPATFFSAGQTAVALTDAEKALITETYGKETLKHTVCRMTEERMDEVLHQYAGTMIWNVDLSEFVFCNETDAYLLVREEVPELRRPEILSCEQLAENQIRMIYRFPGEEQRYCATVLKGETWKVHSNHLLLDKPLNARALTEEEIASVRLTFSPSYDHDPEDGSNTNPRAAFLLDMYADISEMSRSKFLTYYPATEYCEDEAEFQLLKKKYPEEFENEQTIRDMNWPIHRIPASEVEEVMAKYTLANWDDLPYDGWYHYLEETDCYYTYYSDVGLFGFYCTGGWVYDGGAMLYNDFNTPMSVLILTERDGTYYIQSHLPAIVTEG